MNASPIRRVISVTVSAAVLWSPAAPAAAQFRTAAPVTRVAPVAVAPIGGALAAPLSRPSLGSLAVPTLTALTPTLPGGAAVQAAPSAAPALPAAAVPAALSAPTHMPVAAVEAAGAAAPAGANKADQERGSAAQDMDGLSREVAESLESAGPVKDSSPAEAQGLGAKLMDLLLSPFKRGRDKKAPELTPRERRAAMRRVALNAASDERTPAPQADPQVTKQTMLKTLDFVAGVFNAHYMPLDWKKSEFGVGLKAEYDKAKAAIESKPDITTRDFQDIVARFVTSLKDYHVGVQFYSTEMSALPFGIMEAGGKFYLAHIDREALPEEIFPFKTGDEVVAFDGKPVAEVIEGLLRARSEGGNAVTDRSMAARRLTRRIRQGGDEAPQGPVTVAIRHADGRLMGVRMEWQHVPEMIPSAPVRDGGGLFEPPAPPSGPITVANAGEAEVDSGMAAAVRAAFARLVPSGLNPAAALLGRKSPKDRANPFQIGGRESFVPVLGEVLWKSNARSAFNAYIYKAADGRKIGYVRIASYEGDAKEAAAFGELVKKFEAETDALVIDQVNNPGGSLFYMYALLSRLTDKPLTAPLQKVAVGEEDAYESLQTLMAAQQVVSEAQVKQILGPSIGGYATTLKLWKQMVAYAAFIYQEIRAGKRATDLFPFLGIDKIAPHPTDRYTKPILLLVNELDFSCGDFLPAILQDNGRATVFGVRTAGAGGAVKAVQFPNQFGIANLAYTWTIALRANGKPIENLGVTPDVGYQTTEEDLKNGFAGYARAVQEALARILGGPAAPAAPAQP